MEMSSPATITPEQISVKQGVMEMPIIVCPHCENGSDFRTQGSFPDPLKLARNRSVGTCLLCNGTVFFWLSNDDEPVARDYLPRLTIKAPPELPEHVLPAFEEALRCYGIEAWNATGLMCRRAIQETMKEKGAKKGNLPTQLEDLEEKRLITPDLRVWADEARVAGRIGAHGEGGDAWGDPSQIWLEKVDADAVVDFCKSFFEYLYVIPARLAERRRQTAKQPEQGGEAPED